MDVTVPTGTIGGADSAIRPVTGSNAISTPYIPGVTGSATVDNPIAMSTGVMQGPTLPVSTITSSTAANDVTSNIAPTMTNANKAVADQQTKLADAAAAKASAPAQTQQQQDAASGFHNPFGYDPSTGARLNNPNTGESAQPKTPTDTQAILDTPETGYKFAYQADGTRVEIPVGSTSAQYGLSDTKPTSQQSLTALGGINTAIPLDNGNQVAILGNGTYARLDPAGNITGTITKEEYNTEMQNSNVYQKNVETQARKEIQGKMEQIENGSYPLAPWQQDQINNVKQQYADLIVKQQLANANYEGGTKTLQGLLGMSQYSPGVSAGALKAAVDEGISKVASLNSELASTVAKMTEAFQKDNFDMLKTSYDQYNKNVEDRQAEIDKMAERVQHATDERAKVDAAALAEKNKQQDQLTSDINDVMKSAAAAQAPKSVLDAISGAKTLGDALSAAGEYAASSKNSTVQEYIDYKRMAEAAGQKVLSFDEYQTKDANRKAQVAKAGATIMNAGIPSANITDPNASDPQLGGLSKNAVHQAALNYINKGTMPSLGLGQSPSVQAARSAILLEAGVISGGDATNRQQMYNANKKALTDLTQREAFTNAASVTANHNLDLALSQSGEVLRSGVPLVNKAAIIPWQGNIAGTPGLTSFEVYIYTAAREYAKVTSGSAASAQGLTDTAAREAGKLINATQNPEQFAAAVTAMKADMANVSSGFSAEKALIAKQQANINAGKDPNADNRAFDMVQSQAADEKAVTDYGSAHPEEQGKLTQMLQGVDEGKWTLRDVKDYYGIQ